jgi:hypothetical protein
MLIRLIPDTFLQDALRENICGGVILPLTVIPVLVTGFRILRDDIEANLRFMDLFSPMRVSLKDTGGIIAYKALRQYIESEERFPRGQLDKSKLEANKTVFNTFCRVCFPRVVSSFKDLANTIFSGPKKYCILEKGNANGTLISWMDVSKKPSPRPISLEHLRAEYINGSVGRNKAIRKVRSDADEYYRDLGMDVDPYSLMHFMDHQRDLAAMEN